MDYVFNFASPASPPEYLRLAIETLRVGSAGVENTLEIALSSHAVYLHASTSECYGDPLEHPQTESYWGNVNPVGPRSVYDEAKRYAEALVMAYHRSQGVNTHLVRIFNTYGPRLHPNDGRVISNFMMQALRSEPLTIYGDGSQTRSFCYVDDLIDGILLLSRSDEQFPVNFGNPDEFTILECAQAVLEVTGSRSELKFLALPEDDPTRRCPDIKKARALLDWEPRISLREGLAKSLDFFKSKANPKQHCGRNNYLKIALCSIRRPVRGKFGPAGPLFCVGSSERKQLLENWLTCITGNFAGNRSASVSYCKNNKITGQKQVSNVSSICPSRFLQP